jgi:hypothetical protein
VWARQPMRQTSCCWLLLFTTVPEIRELSLKCCHEDSGVVSKFRVSDSVMIYSSLKYRKASKPLFKNIYLGLWSLIKGPVQIIFCCYDEYAQKKRYLWQHAVKYHLKKENIAHQMYQELKVCHYGNVGNSSKIRIHNYLHGSGSFHHQNKKSKKNLVFYCSVTSSRLFIFED